LDREKKTEDSMSASPVSLWSTLSDYQTDGLYRTPNPKPSC